MAEIHAQLSTDCHYLGRFALCHLLLMDDRNYPWLILVPDRVGEFTRHAASAHRIYTAERRFAVEVAAT